MSFQSPVAFVKDTRVHLEQYTLIVLVGPCEETKNIAVTAMRFSIPLFYVHSLGFYSHFSIQLPTLFPIVDTHPDPASTQDLRLLNPWPELATFRQEKAGNLSTLDDHAHGHVPYVLLLLHFLEAWKGTHDGNPPATYAEKKEFKDFVFSGARTSNTEGGEENFDEAAAAVLKSLNPPSISSGLREVFQETAWERLEPTSPSFWWIACGIHDFHRSHNGLLPLPGTLPDMKAQSADYIQLQTIYKKKASDDIAEVAASIKAHNPPHDIPHAEIAEFCKNAAQVKLIRGQPLALPSDLSSAWNGRESELCYQLQEEEGSLLPIYIAFQAYDAHFASLPHDQQPSLLLPNKEDNGKASENMTKYAHTTLSHILKTGGNASEEDDGQPAAQQRMDAVLAEFQRAKGVELHNIAALTGGMVAQEVIKVITKQYVPVDNTCVFDGVQSKSAVFKVGRLEGG